MPDTVIRAAGVVMTREGPEGTEVAVVHRPRRQDWSHPKGKADPGEHLLLAASREAREETGYTVRIGVPLPMQRYLVNGVPKEVHYWRATPVEGTFTPNDEVDVLRWVPVDIGRAALTYPRDAEILDAALATPDTVPLVILRHAAAMKRQAWRDSGHRSAKNDAKRPLSPEGVLQIPAIIGMLEAYRVRAVHSSDATRCRDTVRDHARLRGLTVVDEPAVSEDGHRKQPDGALERAEMMLTAPEATVLCSHRPVLRTLLRGIIGAAEDIDPTDPALDPALPPGAAIVLHRDAARLSRVVGVERWTPPT